MVPLYSSDNYYYFIPHKNTEALRASEVHLSYRVSIFLFHSLTPPYIFHFLLHSCRPLAPYSSHLSHVSFSLCFYTYIIYTRYILCRLRMPIIRAVVSWSITSRKTIFHRHHYRAIVAHYSLSLHRQSQPPTPYPNQRVTATLFCAYSMILHALPAIAVTPAQQ